MSIDTNIIKGSTSSIDSNMNKLAQVRELTIETVSQVGIQEIGFTLNEIFDSSSSSDPRQVTCSLKVNPKRIFSFPLKLADDDGTAYSAEKISKLILEHIRNISIDCAKSAVSIAGKAIGKRAAIAVREIEDNPLPQIPFAFLGDARSEEKTVLTLPIDQIVTNTTKDVAKTLIQSFSEKSSQQGSLAGWMTKIDNM
jgi:hypothetical protein